MSVSAHRQLRQHPSRSPAPCHVRGVRKRGEAWAAIIGLEGARSTFHGHLYARAPNRRPATHPSPASKQALCWPGAGPGIVVERGRRGAALGNASVANLGLPSQAQEKRWGRHTAFVTLLRSPRPGLPASQRLARRAAGACDSSSREGRERVYVALRRIHRRRGPKTRNSIVRATTPCGALPVDQC